MNYLHTMVRVSDIEQSLRFYCELLGMAEIIREVHEEARFTTIFLSAPGDAENAKSNGAPMLELTFNWDTEKYGSGRNFGHLAFRVENIYDTCKKLQQAGVEIRRPPRDGKMAFVCSPDGISIELLQAGSALRPVEPWASMENSGRW